MTREKIFSIPEIRVRLFFYEGPVMMVFTL